MKLVNKILVIACTLLLLNSAQAVNLELSDSLVLSPSDDSKTVSVTLDEIPSKLIKNNGAVKKANIKVKPKLTKADKRKFSLSPKTLKIKVNKDGTITPASLTVSAITEEEGDYPLSLKTNRKVRKKLGVEATSETISLGDTITIKGQLKVPSDDESKFLVKNQVVGAEVELRHMDLSSAGSSIETLGTGTTDSQGFFTIDIPFNIFNENLGPGLMCLVEGSGIDLRSFVNSNSPIIDPHSEFIVQRINDDNSSSDISSWASSNVVSDLQSYVGGIDLESFTSISSALEELEDTRSTGCTTYIAGAKNGADTTKPLLSDRVLQVFGLEIGPAINFAGQDGSNPIVIPTNSTRGHKSLYTMNANTNSIFSSEVTTFREIEVRSIQAPPDKEANAQEFFTVNDQIHSPGISSLGTTFVTTNGFTFVQFEPPKVEDGDIKASTEEGKWNLYYNDNADTMIGVKNFTKTTDTNKEETETFGAILHTGLIYFSTFQPNTTPVSAGQSRVYGLDYISSSNGQYSIGTVTGKCQTKSNFKRECSDGEYELVSNNLYGGSFGVFTLPVIANGSINFNNDYSKFSGQISNGINFLYPGDYESIIINGAILAGLNFNTQNDNGDNIISSRVLIDSHVDPLDDPLRFGFIWVLDGYSNDGRITDYRYGEIEFKLVDTTQFQVDFGPIFGENLLVPFDPLLGDLTTLAPTIIDPLDPNPMLLPIPPDPSILGFELATQSMTFECSISSNKNLMACQVIKEDESTGTKAVGVGIGVRKK